MDKLQMVEELVRRTNSSYSEAKEALENSGWNMLDAIVYLESKGVTCGSVKFRKQTGKFCNTAKKAWNKCCAHNFQVKKDGGVIAEIPLAAAIILTLIFFEFIVPAALIALFFGISFAVTEKGTGNTAAETPAVNGEGCGFNIMK